MNSRNEQLFARAQIVIPGGVNSPVRAFRAVGGTPRFFARGEGAYVWDADGKRYIDYVGSWGPAILGHAHPETVRAVQETARNTGAIRGTQFAREMGLSLHRLREMARTEKNVLRSDLAIWTGTRPTAGARRRSATRSRPGNCGAGLAPSGAPRTPHVMLRRRGRMRLFRLDQFPAPEVLQRALDAAFRESSRRRDLAQARGNRLPAGPLSLAIEMQVNEERGRMLFVLHEIAQQEIEHVGIHRERRTGE